MEITFFESVILTVFFILVIVVVYQILMHYWFEQRIKFNAEASVLQEGLYGSCLCTPRFVVKSISILRDCGNNASPIAMYVIETTFPTGYGGTKTNTFPFYNAPNIFQVGDVLTLEKVKETLKSDESLVD
jgi:hypothetical protein